MAAAMSSLAAMSITNQGRSSFAPVSSRGRAEEPRCASTAASH
jgi:hypothetical protein